VLVFIAMSSKKVTLSAPKRSAKLLEDKVAMIKQYEKGEKVVAIARLFGLSRTTVSPIVYGKVRILSYI